MTRTSSRPVDELDPRSPRASRAWLVAVVVGACALLGGALPAQATHFRYGTIDWVPAQPPAGARTIVFELADAFRRAPTVNESSLAHCVSITAANFATSNTATCTHSPGDGYPGVGDVVREDIGGTQFFFGDCTANSDCGTGGTCSSNQCTAGNNPGGRHVPTGSTPMFYVVTSIDVPNNWMYVQGLDPSTFGTPSAVIDTTISHTYPGTTATFTAGLDDGNRISLNDPPNAHINNPDFTYVVQTTVNVGGTFAGNSSPVSTQVPIVNCPISTDAPCPPGLGATCTFTVPAVDPNGDTLFFRMSTAAEASRTAGFTQPGPPDSTFAAGIDSSTGVYTWNTCGATVSTAKACDGGTNDGHSCTSNANCPSGGTCQTLTSLYSTQVIVEDRSGATVKSHVPVDFLIQLVPQVVNNDPPVFDHPPTPLCGSTQTVLAGNNLSFTVQASDPDALPDTVTLNVAGLPSGATMTPSLPTAGNPVSSAFSWTPTAANVGDFIVNFSATDTHNVQVTCPITIEVQCNVALCDDGNVCTTDSCSAPLGSCQHTNNTDSCDDGSLCTTDDTCQAGACVGTPVVCSNGDQCNDPGTCQPATGLCSAKVPHGGSCDDSSLCTTGDTCQAGICVGAPVVCSNGDQCNDPGTCQPATGLCSAKVPHGGSCNDSSLCTTGDTCQAGICVGAPVVCSNGDQCNDPGTCQPATGLCSAKVPHGGSCNDSSLCTTGDTCQAGICVGTPVVCTAPDQCHVPGTCDTTSGQCSNSTTAPDGTSCSDGRACSTGDQCVGGVCHGDITGCPLEICADQIDNNDDGLIDCLDPECPACPPIVDTCKHPCVSQITFEKRGLDLLHLQASFKPLTTTNPATEQFGVLITDADGVVFTGLLPPGALRSAGKTFTATVKSAKTLGGIYKVKITTLTDGSYRVNVKAYAEMSASANLPVMTVQVRIGNDVAVSTTTWRPLKVGWRAQLP